MKQILTILLFSLLFILVNNEVIDLTESNFDNTLNSYSDQKFLLVFYSPSCPHCLQFLPIIEELSNKKIDHAAFGKVNCNEEENLADRFEIDFVPNIYLITKNQAYSFGEHERSKENIEHFINNPSIFAIPQDIPEKVVHAGIFRHFFLKYQKQLAQQEKRKLRLLNKKKQ